MEIIGWTTEDGECFCADHAPAEGHPVFALDEGADDVVASCGECLAERLQAAENLPSREGRWYSLPSPSGTVYFRAWRDRSGTIRVVSGGWHLILQGWEWANQFSSSQKVSPRRVPRAVREQTRKYGRSQAGRWMAHARGV
jgi:hypothetical protein